MDVFVLSFSILCRNGDLHFLQQNFRSDCPSVDLWNMYCTDLEILFNRQNKFYENDHFPIVTNVLPGI